MLSCAFRVLGVNPRIAVLTLCCISGWFMGQFLANFYPPKSVTPGFEKVVEISNKAPLPKKQKCNRWSPCPKGSFAFQIVSGGGNKKLPKMCFEDEIILGDLNAGRGINIAYVNASTGEFVDSATFDMWSGDNSGALVEYIHEMPNNSFVLMATFDDGSTKLKPEAKKEIEKLGSTLITKIAFRASWVFLGGKNITLPNDFRKEKILFSNKKWNKYKGWPSEIQIDGCVGQAAGQ